MQVEGTFPLPMTSNDSLTASATESGNMIIMTLSYTQKSGDTFIIDNFVSMRLLSSSALCFLTVERIIV